MVSVVIIVAFALMVLTPCVIALFGGWRRDTEDALLEREAAAELAAMAASGGALGDPVSRPLNPVPAPRAEAAFPLEPATIAVPAPVGELPEQALMRTLLDAAEAAARNARTAANAAEDAACVAQAHLASLRTQSAAAMAEAARDAAEQAAAAAAQARTDYEQARASLPRPQGVPRPGKAA